MVGALFLMKNGVLCGYEVWMWMRMGVLGGVAFLAGLCLLMVARGGRSVCSRRREWW